MNTRIAVAAALAVGAAFGSLLSHALPPAQAQTPPASQSLDAKVARLESRVDALQAQVTQLNIKQTIILDHNLGGFNNSRGFNSPPSPPYTNSPYTNIPSCRGYLLGQSAH